MAIATGTEAAIGTARAGAPAIMAMAGVTRIAGPSGAGTIGYASAVDLAGNHPRAAAGVAALLSLNSPLILQIVCHGRACPTRMPGPVPMAGMMARNAIVSAPHLGSGLRRGGRKEARRLSSMTRAIGKILDKLDSFRQNKKRTNEGVADHHEPHHARYARVRQRLQPLLPGLRAVPGYDAVAVSRNRTAAARAATFSASGLAGLADGAPSSSRPYASASAKARRD